jgi:hypothetical protein
MFTINVIYPLSKIFHSVYNFFSRPKENGIDPHTEHPVKRMHSSRVSPNGIIKTYYYMKDKAVHHHVYDQWNHVLILLFQNAHVLVTLLTN